MIQIADINYNSTRNVIAKPESPKLVRNNEPRHATRQNKNIERRISILFPKGISPKINNSKEEKKEIARCMRVRFARFRAADADGGQTPRIRR